MPTVRKKIKIEMDADLLMNSLLHLHSAINFLKEYSDADTEMLGFLEDELTNAVSKQSTLEEVKLLTKE